MLKNFLEEFWWLVAFIIIAVIVITVAIIMGVNGNGLNIVEWTINPANPSSPVHQIMP